MANTYTQIYIHIVFTVKGRQNLIRRERNDELVDAAPTELIACSRPVAPTERPGPLQMSKLQRALPATRLQAASRRFKSPFSKSMNRYIMLKILS
jgi:hypothetical protein